MRKNVANILSSFVGELSLSTQNLFPLVKVKVLSNRYRNKTGVYAKYFAKIKNPEGRISVVLTDGVTPTPQQSIALLFSQVFIAHSPSLASLSLPCAEPSLFSHEQVQQLMLDDCNQVNEEQTLSFVLLKD